MIIGPFYCILKTKPFHGCSKRCIMNIYKGTLGVEPRTCRTAAGCSTTELYPLHVIYLDQKNYFFSLFFFPKEALNNKDEIKEEKKKESSHLGIEPRTFGLEVQRAILCANGTGCMTCGILSWQTCKAPQLSWLERRANNAKVTGSIPLGAKIFLRVSKMFARAGARTLDRQVKSLTLYRLSYPGRCLDTKDSLFTKENTALYKEGL